MNQSPQDKIQEGFSSEQQIEPQQIIYHQTIKQKTQATHKQEVKFKLPPAQQIKDKKYSLHPDIITGWQPKINLPSPIPIIFQSSKYDNIIKRLLKLPPTMEKKIRLIYLGPKYENTYYAWYDKSFDFPYSHIKSPHSIKFSQRPFCGQHWDAESQQILKFDSFFESGNLDCVVQVGQAQYDLFMRVDSNTRGHLQWYNFRIKNLKKDKQYKINICNFQKKKILYDRGLKPYIFSKEKDKKQKIGWEQSGQNIIYDKKISKTFKYLGIESSKYFKLSFTISTYYQNDQLQIAYCVPYTYSLLNQYLNGKFRQLQKSGREILKKMKLCETLGGLQVPLLVIHENYKDKTESSQEQDGHLLNIKKCVIICGRAHPGESNGSFMMEGFLDFILSDNKMAQFLRKHVIFKIVPMINPDGVALGNYRTGLSGKDFNREYKDPDKEVFPQVYAFKQLVTENKFLFKDNFQLFLDFHGHSVKKNTFAYGPQFVITNKFYYQSRILPKLISRLTPMFRYYSCSFKIAQCKFSTARAILLKKLNISLAYTIQTSNGFYFDYQKLKDIPYTDSKWKAMGQKVGQGIFQYIELIAKSQLLRYQKQVKNKQIGNCNNFAKKKDIIIRKNHARVAASQNKNHYHGNIQIKNVKNLSQNDYHTINLQGIQDQNIKLLFQQIKQDEQRKSHILQNEKCSDDQLSQGSSDSQGQGDDLSSKQLQKLFKCIKNKKFKNIDKCRISPVKRMRTDDLQYQVLEHQIDDNDDSNDLKQKQKNESQINNRRSQQVLSKKNSIKMDPRKQFIFNLIQSKKRSNTPKVINFSFGFTPQKRGLFIDERQKQRQKSSILPSSKINIFDVSIKSKKNDININQNEINSHLKVDKNKFTDLIFRKTFNHSAPKDISIQNGKQMNNKKQKFMENIFSTTNYSTVKKFAKLYNTDQKIKQRQDSPRNSSELITSTCQTFYPSNNTRSRHSRFQNHRMKKSFVENIKN